MKKEFFAAGDGKQISFSVWDEVDAPRAVVQITHGMSEHINRYDGFAQFLNSQGFIAAGFDSRGHGETDKDALGASDKPESDIFSNTVTDMQNFNAQLSLRYKLPVIVLGHSYGSLLAQEYIRRGGKAVAFVLVGSALMNGLDLKFGSWMAARKVRKGKAAEKGYLFANLTFGAYDKKIKEGKAAWISTDKEVVSKYNADPWCGYACSNGFYSSMFKGLRKLTKNNFTDKTAKILIVAGDKDEFGKRGKLPTKLYKNYKKHGFENIELKLYENMRHEILHEPIKETVFADIASFIEKTIKTNKNN